MTGTAVGGPYTGHDGAVTAVAGEESTVDSAGDDATVRVWDGGTAAPPLVGHTDTVRAVAFGVVGGRRAIVSGGDDATVRVWDARGGRVISGHTDAVLSLAVGELGGRVVVVSGGDDGTVRVWDLVTGAAVGSPYVGHAGPVNAVAIGRGVVVSGGDDGTVRFWEPRGPRTVDVGSAVLAIATTPDGGVMVGVEEGLFRIVPDAP